MAGFSVRPVHPGDRAGWDALYRGYAEFYRVDQTPAMRDRVWTWLHDPAGEVRGLVAEREHDGALLGLAHYRAFARPLSASVGCFLDDLFVAPEARGSGVPEARGRDMPEMRGPGVAAALMAELRGIAAAEGWSVIRWITADDNYRARGLYDRVATRTGWVTYDMAPGG